jgi:Protein of unknown function (DUF3558)
MTLKSFSRSLMIVTAVSVLVTLTACGPGTSKTSGPAPARPATASAPAAPIVQDDQMSPDPLCSLITVEDATNALGFNPGRSHIDTSEVFFLTERACVWGDPKPYNSTPVVDISAKEYKSANAAQAAFNKFRAHQHTIFTDPNMALDAAIGYGAVILPTAGAASSTVCSKQWVVTILFVRKDRTANQAEASAIKLSQAVVKHLP